jgi:hypothetical protein
MPLPFRVRFRLFKLVVGCLPSSFVVAAHTSHDRCFTPPPSLCFLPSPTPTPSPSPPKKRALESPLFFCINLSVITSVLKRVLRKAGLVRRFFFFFLSHYLLSFLSNDCPCAALY